MQMPVSMVEVVVVARLVPQVEEAAVDVDIELQDVEVRPPKC